MTSKIQLVLALALFVVCSIDMASSAPSNVCLLQCMKDVLKCKRDENVGIVSEMECCDKYTLCYFVCQPDAEGTPPCSSTKGKRGSWNKRESWNNIGF